MKTVLFVCSGNTCRSPMAEAIFDNLIDEHPSLKAQDVRIRSAGTFAVEGAEMTGFAQQTLEKMGIEPPRKHKATHFNSELAEEADLILAMQEQHLEEISALCPEAENKAHTLKGYAHYIDGYTGSEEYDIEDPFCQPFEEYYECGLDIKQQIELLLGRLEKEWKE